VEQISRIGMDTSKHFFQLHGVNAAKKVVLRKKLRRKEMVAFLLRFFLLALVVAAAVHLVFASDALRIGVFFTFVLTLSLFFPSTWGAVDKEAVDLIYYGTAMSVAAVFFLAKEVERKRLELAPQINLLAQQQHEVEAEISSFDYVANNAPKLLNWIDRRVDEAFDDTERSLGWSENSSRAAIGRLSSAWMRSSSGTR
jgi:hypothetical protein